MTIEQITAISNGMSMLVDIAQYAKTTNSLDAFKKYTDRHVKALKDAGVHEYIVEHFEALIHPWIPVAQQSEVDNMRWVDCCADFDEMESNHETAHISSREEDLAALQALKATLEARN